MFFSRFRQSAKSGEGSGQIINPERRQLLHRHISGDREAFPELVQLYQSQVYSYLVRTGVEPDERDDLFQEIFMAVHRSAAAYDPELALDPWIFAITANKVRDHYRKRRVAKICYCSEPPEPSSDSQDAEAQTSANETKGFLEQALLGLPLDQREIFLLCGLQEVRLKDLARSRKLPLGTVKTKLFRARQTLIEAFIARTAQIKEEGGV